VELPWAVAQVTLASSLASTLGTHIPQLSCDADPSLAFRALALTHLERLDEAEKSYHAALRLAPGHAFALPGLKKLYVKNQRWDDLGRLLELQVQAAYDACVELTTSSMS
jgi:superkiller protein 3